MAASTFPSRRTVRGHLCFRRPVWPIRWPDTPCFCTRVSGHFCFRHEHVCGCAEGTDAESCACVEAEAPGGPVLLSPLEKGVTTFTRSGHGWATTAGVLRDGKILPTFDREGERMLAAEHKGGIDVSQLVPFGFLNDSHRAVPAPGAGCPGRCTKDKPDPSCGVHGGKRWSVLVGIIDSIEYVGPEHPLALRDGKVGWYDQFHFFDAADPASWRNPDGTPRKRMLRDGTVTDIPVEPTPEELKRADALWKLGLELQAEGRTIGQSIQGRETAVPCEGGKCILRARVYQIAAIEFPHNPDATVEGLGAEMAKGESAHVARLANRLLREPTIRARFNVRTPEAALRAARRLLREESIHG